jgi:predicted MFS family arabinose efflux permease
VTYLFAMGAVIAARLPTREPHVTERGMRRLVSGFVVARSDRLVGRILVTMSLFSFFCLAFIGLMPALADDNLGMDTRTLAYGLLYAGFGLGAAAGAVSIGTVLAQRSKTAIIRWGLLAFSVFLAGFAVERTPALAYPTALALGFAYFATVTSMSTVLQENLDDRIRGRVMALWIMSFGGTVPLGTLAGGAIAARTSITAVLLAGAVVAVALAAYADLSPLLATRRVKLWA